MSNDRSNVLHLAMVHKDLGRLGVQAERYFAEDPNTCLLKLRQFAELTAARAGIYQLEEDNQASLLGRLKAAGYLSHLFHLIRKIGKETNHQFAGDHRTAPPFLGMFHAQG